MENKENKKEKNNKVKIIIAIVIILVIIAGILIIWKFLPKHVEENIINDISEELLNKSTASGNSADINNVIITNEGIKVNVSPKIIEEREFGKYVIKDMNVSAQNGKSTITFTIINNSNSNISNKDFTVKFLNNKGKEIGKVTSKIENLEAQKEQIVYVYSESDLSNAYSFSFKM